MTWPKMTYTSGLSGHKRLKIDCEVYLLVVALMINLSKIKMGWCSS